MDLMLSITFADEYTFFFVAFCYSISTLFAPKICFPYPCIIFPRTPLRAQSSIHPSNCIQIWHGAIIHALHRTFHFSQSQLISKHGGDPPDDGDASYFGKRHAARCQKGTGFQGVGGSWGEAPWGWALALPRMIGLWRTWMRSAYHSTCKC